MQQNLFYNSYSLQDDFNFQRQKKSQQKYINHLINEQNIKEQPQEKPKKKWTQMDLIDGIKRAKKNQVNPIQQSIQEITQKRGRQFQSQPCSFHKDEDEEEEEENVVYEINFQGAGTLVDYQDKSRDKSSSLNLPSLNNRLLTFYSLSKSSSVLMNRNRNTSSSKTKTQQFQEKTALVQKMVPQQMIQICKEDDFEKIKVLGKGASGIVEKQLFKPLSLEVAMKKYFDQQKKDEFDSEVYIMNTKQSEHIPKLIYYRKENLSIYMELGMITLDTYEGYLRKNRVLFQENFGIWILNQLLTINKHMFQEQYHHSDIKPANIILTFNEKQEMKMKLIDFGAASIFPQDYWIQYTPYFQCPQLLKKIEQREILTRYEILYAEFFASCRSIQLLTLANHPKRSVLFPLESITQYLLDEEIKKRYEYLLIVFSYVFQKRSNQMNEQDITFLQLILNTYVNIKQYEQEIEQVYLQSNFID